MIEREERKLAKVTNTVIEDLHANQRAAIHCSLRQCLGKKTYRTFQEAERSAGYARRARNREDEHYSTYHCRDCQGFHYGSRIGPKLRKPRAEVVSDG